MQSNQPQAKFHLKSDLNCHLIYFFDPNLATGLTSSHNTIRFWTKNSINVVLITPRRFAQQIFAQSSAMIEMTDRVLNVSMCTNSTQHLQILKVSLIYVCTYCERDGGRVEM